MHNFEIFNKASKTKHNIGLGTLDECINLKYDFLKKGTTSKYRHIQLFIHIPYCVEKCSFCVYFYNKIENSNQLKDLIKDLDYEVKILSNALIDYPIDAIYIGGGTVSLLSINQLQQLTKIIKNHFKVNLNQANEYTVELYPLNTNEKKLEVLFENGINRLSFGIQTFNEKILIQNTRRNPSYTSFSKLISNARTIGFNHINVDLLIGIEGNAYEILQDDFELLSKITIDTITIYINMNIYRNDNNTIEKNKYIEWILAIESKFKQFYTLNNGNGVNEYNVFQRKSFHSPFSIRYEDTTKNDVLCVGVGKYADSSYGDIIFKYL